MNTPTTIPPPEASTVPASERLGVDLPRLVRELKCGIVRKIRPAGGIGGVEIYYSLRATDALMSEAADAIGLLEGLCERAKFSIQAEFPETSDIDDFVTDFDSMYFPNTQEQTTPSKP